MVRRIFMDVEFEEADKCYFCGSVGSEKLSGKGLEMLNEEEGDSDVYRCPQPGYSENEKQERALRIGTLQTKTFNELWRT